MKTRILSVAGTVVLALSCNAFAQRSVTPNNGLAIIGGQLVPQFGASQNTVAQGNDSRIVGAAQASNNLSDIPNPAMARVNLGLGGAASLNVGTTTGTVAAGDDSRIPAGTAGAASGAVLNDVNGDAVTAAINATRHLTGTSFASNIHITTTAVGSGVNGPGTAQNGISVRITKDNWNSTTTPAAVGEIDGLSITGRQGGAGSDLSGLLVDVQNTGLGFLSSTEMVSTILNPTTSQITQGMDVQEGVLNAGAGDYIGVVYTATAGALSHGIRIQNNPGSSWGDVIQYLVNGGQVFDVDGAGNVTTTGNIGLSHSVVAAAGTTFATATQLTKQYTVVNSSTPGGVILPPAFDVLYHVFNDTSAPLTVYTPAGATLITMAAFTTGKWFANSSATYINDDSVPSSIGGNTVLGNASGSTGAPAALSQSQLMGLLVPGSIPGQPGAANAIAGSIGEFSSASVAVGSAVALTTSVAADVASITLTPGDWDVSGTICFTPGAATAPTVLRNWIYTVPNAAPNPPNGGAYNLVQAALTVGASQCASAGTTRLQSAASQTVYLETAAVFTGGTLGAYGYISARRAQ